jgi:hypothetical protein
MSDATAPSPAPARSPEAQRLAITRRSGLAWATAGIASVVAGIGWWPRLGARVEVSARERSVASARAALLREPDALIVPWVAAGDPRAPRLEGDVVWSGARQRGFARFVPGLAANDPSREQYQLWIFDADRDERYPVDGGLFDAVAADELVVPLIPKLRVHRPKLFAITLEPPGGVVVSRREHLLAVAKSEP